MTHEVPRNDRMSSVGLNSPWTPYRPTGSAFDRVSQNEDTVLVQDADAIGGHSRSGTRRRRRSTIGANRLIAGGSPLQPFFTLGKWLAPMGACFLGNVAMQVMLHVGTYYYVRIMDRFESSYDLHGPAVLRNDTLSPGLSSKTVSFGSLEDPLEGYLGWRNVSLAELDAASAVLPMAWLLATVGMRDLHGWTKVLVCHGVLAFFKGLFGCITIVPDSIGWNACKERFGQANLSYLRHHVPDPASDGFLAMVGGILQLESRGIIDGKPVRFCADMLYSGHTFVTCLYGLALVEVFRKVSVHWSLYSRVAGMVLLNAFVVLEQAFEVTLVLQNRFHYTMDVVMAMLMVLLWYTNAAVALASQRWSTFGEGFRGPQPGDVVERQTRNDIFQFLESGELQYELVELPDFLPPGTQEFAFSKGFAVVGSTRKDGGSNGKDKLPIGLQEWANLVGMKLVSKEATRRDGDIWIPSLCVPFSCCGLWGKHHVVSDHHFNAYGEESADHESVLEALSCCSREVRCCSPDRG